jgi:hypothetical protein
MGSERALRGFLSLLPSFLTSVVRILVPRFDMQAAE